MIVTLRQDIEKVLDGVRTLRSALQTWAGRGGPGYEEGAVGSRRRKVERAVLGCLLLDPGLLPEISERLGAEDFLAAPHRVLYRAMLDLRSDGAGIDLRSLEEEFERQGQLAAAGGLAYLAGLDLVMPDISRIDAYVDQLTAAATSASRH